MILEPAVDQARPGQQQNLQDQVEHGHGARDTLHAIEDEQHEEDQGRTRQTALAMRMRSGIEAKRQTPR